MAKRERDFIGKMKSNIKNFFSQQWKFFISMPAILWQSIFLLLPLCILFFSSFMLFKSGNFVKFTFDNYRAVFNLTHFYVILRSIFLAFLNSCLCLIVAYPVAYFLSIRVTKFKNLSLFFLTLPFWINFLVHIYSWFFILDRYGLLNSILVKLGIISEPIHILNTVGAMMIVMFHGYLPFMIMPIYTVLEKLDKQLIEASLDLGATRLYTLFKVIVPLSFTGILAGFALVFVLSYGEFLIPSLVGGGKNLFVGTLISDYFLSIRNFYQGAAFTFLSAAFLGLALFICYLILKYLIGVKKES